MNEIQEHKARLADAQSYDDFSAAEYLLREVEHLYIYNTRTPEGLAPRCLVMAQSLYRFRLTHL